MSSPSPDGWFASQVEGIAKQAARGAVLAFAGLRAARFQDEWPGLSESLTALFLDVQSFTLDATGDYLSEVAGAPVTPARGPWLGRIGEMALADWLAITPRAYESRLAQMSPTESLMATVTHITARADTEPHRVAREATAVTASEHGMRWARIPEPGACAFCRMLASRGAVYTKETVLRTDDGLKYHPHCRCRAKAMKAGEGKSEWTGSVKVTASQGAKVTTLPTGRATTRKAAPAVRGNQLANLRKIVDLQQELRHSTDPARRAALADEIRRLRAAA